LRRLVETTVDDDYCVSQWLSSVDGVVKYELRLSKTPEEFLRRCKSKIKIAYDQDFLDKYWKDKK
jgi:hypothetical protein